MATGIEYEHTDVTAAIREMGGMGSLFTAGLAFGGKPDLSSSRPSGLDSSERKPLICTYQQAGFASRIWLTFILPALDLH